MQRHAGAPLKPVVAHWQDSNGMQHALQGECVATANGIEGSLIYALAADLRAQIDAHGVAELVLDLIPGRSFERVHAELAQPRKGRSFSEHLRRQVGIDGVKAALLTKNSASRRATMWRWSHARSSSCRCACCGRVRSPKRSVRRAAYDWKRWTTS